MIHANLLITKKNKGVFTFLVQDNLLVDAKIHGDEASLLHSIRIGKVKNIVKNIQAAFVEIAPNQMAYLPLEDCKNPIITNRSGNHLRLQEGDEVLVQIVKEAVKTKDPVITTNLVFTGKYALLSTGKKHVGFSGKLGKECKTKIQQYLQSKKEAGILSANYGIVVRTNAGNLDDYKYLLDEILQLDEKLNTLLEVAKYRTCFSILFQEDKPYLKNLRDSYESDYDAITTDNQEIYQQLLEISNVFPNLKDKIRFYKDEKLPLWKLYSLDTKLEEALGKRIWLKSGGYLIIEPTEALTVIDVNSGKYHKNKSREEATLAVNREAAIEIARQLRLRNISGIIIIDFINMEQKGHGKEVLQLLSEEVLKDAIPTKVVDMTALGLVEVTRKKVEKSLYEQYQLVR
ncbi:MAG: ribonuclease E/G [Eubacteriales bacterium]